MQDLNTKISNAKTTEELEAIVDSIKKQNNGSRNELASHLTNVFWYVALADNITEQKKWMIHVADSYPDSLKQFNG